VIIKQDLHNDKAVGRLGNKLFIIATMIGLAKSTRQPFAISKDWVYANIFDRIPLVGDVTYQVDQYQEPYHYYSELPTDFINIQLNGYFQSVNYFKHCSQDVSWYLTPNTEVTHDINDRYKQFNDVTTTSIHIRRGDYIKPNTGFIDLMSCGYYNRAIEYIDDITDTYLVFSDDIEWCKSQFNNDKMVFVNPQDALYDMMFMAKCDNHIIANSSYSWWGAYLGSNPSKCVIYPTNWWTDNVPSDYRADTYKVDGWIGLC